MVESVTATIWAISFTLSAGAFPTFAAWKQIGMFTKS